MAKKTDHEAIRDKLLTGAIRAGAEYGLANITNQRISEQSGLPEMYIYRYYVDRNDLIEKAFLRADAYAFEVFTTNAPILFGSAGSRREHYYEFMNRSWDSLTEDYDYCKFYIRYYYSIENTMDLRMKHKEICLGFYETIKKCFLPDMDTDTVMHRLFTAVISSVMDMAMGIVTDTPEKRRNLFDFLYSIIKPYVKEEYRL